MEKLRQAIEQRWPRLTAHVQYTTVEAKLPLIPVFGQPRDLLSIVLHSRGRGLITNDIDYLHANLGCISAKEFIKYTGNMPGYTERVSGEIHYMLERHAQLTGAIRVSPLPIPIRDAILEQF